MKRVEFQVWVGSPAHLACLRARDNHEVSTLTVEGDYQVMVAHNMALTQMSTPDDEGRVSVVFEEVSIH